MKNENTGMSYWLANKKYHEKFNSINIINFDDYPSMKIKKLKKILNHLTNK